MKLFSLSKREPQPAPTMGELIARQFHGQQMRIVRVDGRPYFVAKDVCDILGISNHKDAVSRLDADEKEGVGITDPLGGKQTATGITESGLYALIFKSRKETAREFRKWVTAEVLPSIRQTGGYSEGSGSALVAQVLEGQKELLGHIGRLAEGVAALAERVSRLEERPASRMLPLLPEGRESQDMFDMVRAINVQMLRRGLDRMDLRFSELAEICSAHTIFRQYLSWDVKHRLTPRACAMMGLALKNQFDNRLVKCDGDLLHTCIVGHGRARRYTVLRMDQDDYP